MKNFQIHYDKEIDEHYIGFNEWDRLFPIGFKFSKTKNLFNLILK